MRLVRSARSATCIAAVWVTFAQAETTFVARTYRERPAKVASAQQIIRELTAAVADHDAAGVVRLATDPVSLGGGDTVSASRLKAMLQSPKPEWGSEVDVWSFLRRGLEEGFTLRMPGQLCAPHTVHLMRDMNDGVVGASPAPIRAQASSSARVLEVVRNSVLRVDSERWYSPDHAFLRQWIPVVGPGDRVGYVLRDHIWLPGDVGVCLEQRGKVWRVSVVGSLGPPA